MGTFLVDGFVRGQWRLERSKRTATLILEPFEPLTDEQRTDLVAEGERLLAFSASDATQRTTAFGVARPAPPGTPRGQWAPADGRPGRPAHR